MFRCTHSIPALCRIIALVAALLSVLPTRGQNINVPTSGDNTIILQPGSSCTVYDPGGSGNYPNNCNGTLTIISADTTPITVTGSYYVENGYDYLFLYDGADRTSHLMGRYTGVGNIDNSAINGAITIHFRSDDNSTRTGFSLSISACPIEVSPVYNVTIDDISQTSATLHWNDSSDASCWTVFYGTSPYIPDQQRFVTSTSVTLDNLQIHTLYYFRIKQDTTGDEGSCVTKTHNFKTTCDEPFPSCLDYSNLTSCHVSAYYGDYYDPNLNNGLVDEGSGSSYSRHTVHTDTTEYDPRTNYMLKTVPPGYTASVRLGNWRTGGEAESLVYDYHVDTLASSLLIMKYAAVLQDPNHTDAEQPKFSFQILDENGQEVNASCYSANFIADENLGWNTANTGGGYSGNSSILWKDWTTVGIDLSPLHGQTIQIKLSSHDCGRQGHYGYAYFVFDCGEKTLHTESCGDVIENTFTAPEGFSYRWYRSDQPTVTLSTNRSLHVTQAGEYHCSIQFIGAPAGSDCSFDLTAMAGERYPTALFSWDSIGNDECDQIVQLHNNSVVSLDATHQQLTSTPCDAYVWIVDSMEISNAVEPIITLTPGAHTIQLIASIGNGTCSDSTTQTLLIGNPCYHADTVVAAVCHGESYPLFDTTISAGGIYERDSGYHHRTLMLSILDINDTAIHDTLVENSLPHSFASRTYNISDFPSSGHTIDTTFVLSNLWGCDSTVHYSITVYKNSGSHQDSAICEGALPLTWNGVTFTSSATDTAILPGSEMHGADSIVSMNVTVIPNSILIRHDTVVENNLPVFLGGLEFNNSHGDTTWTIANNAGCDSIITYSIHVWNNVTAVADSTICEGALPLTWNGTTFTQESTVIVNLSSLGIYATHGEDSILTMHLHLLHNSSHWQKDTVVENNLPAIYGGINFHNAISDTSWIIPNQAGCDSLIHYSLHVWLNYRHYFDTVVCDNLFPVEWCGLTFYSGGDTTVTYPSQHGADSTVTLTLHTNPSYSVNDTSAICQGETSTYGIGDAGDYDIPLTTVHGCDSLIHLQVVVNPVYDLHFFDTICDNQSVMFDGVAVNTPGLHHFTHTTAVGCDSLLTLELTVNQTYHIFDHAKVCDGVPYRWIDGNTYGYSTYEPTVTYSDINGCDSTHHLILELNDGFQVTMQVSPTTVTPSQPEVRLRDLSESVSRQWFILDHIDTNRTCIYTFPTGYDSMEVLLVARNRTGCIDSAWATVSCDRSTVWAPNAFTPDESQNNLFFIPSHDIEEGEVFIYTREGMLVTRFDAIGGFWDGTYRGKACKQDTYVWVMTYSTKANPRQKLQARGTVTLLR